MDDSDDEAEELEDSTLNNIQSMSGVAQLIPMLHPSEAEPPPDSRSPSPFPQGDLDAGKPKSKKKKRKGRGKSKPSKWANKCMYAELLEMNTDPIWSSTWTHEALSVSDGLPDDLETAWVALAPVPAGKRCLAVTMQSAGVSGVGASAGSVISALPS